MIGFTQYLTEASGQKNTHLTHLEDVVLDDGPSGVKFALKVLNEFGRMLDGGKVSRSLNVSVKWDGAPAIVFGPDPADKKFFVATKGAFNKNPKLAKSHADIDSMYAQGPKDLLHVCFDELQKLQPKTIIQGDMLFTRDSLDTQEIDGKMFYTFRPNTILYAVDAASELASQIRAAGMGIVLHTMYTGKSKSITDFSASALSPSVFSSLKKSPRVLAMDANYDDVSGTVTFTEQEQSDFWLAYDAVESSAGSVGSSTYGLLLSEPLHGYLQMYINDRVRQNMKLMPNDSVNDLLIYLQGKKDKEVSARKTLAGQQAQADKFNQLIRSVSVNRKQIAAWFRLHAAIQRAKDIVVRKLGQASRIASFVPTDTGFRVTGPEGFVAVARDGKAVKLVDRLEFSRLNATLPKNWSK